MEKTLNNLLFVFIVFLEFRWLKRGLLRLAVKNAKIRKTLIDHHFAETNKDGSVDIEKSVDFLIDLRPDYYCGAKVVYFASIIVAIGLLPFWVHIASLVSDTPTLRMAGFVISFALPLLLNEKYLVKGNKWHRYYQKNNNLSPQKRKQLLRKNTIGVVILLAIFVLCWVFLR